MTGLAKLFTAQATDGNSSDIEFIGGVSVTLVVQKVSGTATVKLQMSPDEGTTWVDVDGVSLTASGTKLSPVLPRCKLRLNQSSSSTPVINAWVGA